MIRAQTTFTSRHRSAVLQLLKLPDGTVKVLVEGSQRARNHPKIHRTVKSISKHGRIADDTAMSERPRKRCRGRSSRSSNLYVKLNKKIPPEVLVSVNQIEDPSKLADTVAAHLAFKIPRSRNCWKPSARSSGLSVCSRSWKARSTFWRSKSASVAASSARWRRPSASII